MGLRTYGLAAGAALVVTAAMVAVCSWLVGYPPDLGIDDAHITFLYSERLAGGHGLVYQLGGERVEGFSSPLFMLLGVPFAAITSDFGWAMLGINVVSLALALAYFLIVIDRIFFTRMRHLALATLIVWLLQPAFWTWNTISLLETGLWTALLLGSLAFVLEAAHDGVDARRCKWLAVLLPLVVLCRPEGVLWAGVMLAALFLLARRDGATHAIAIPFATCILVGGAYLAFRIAYFGYPLPNTYYAKLMPDFQYRTKRALTFYLWQFAKTYWLIIPIGVAAVAFIMRGARQHALVILNVFILLWLFVPVYEGGDHFMWWRMYQPLWPIALVPIIAWATRARLGAVVCVVVLVLALVGNIRTWRHFASRTRNQGLITEFEIPDQLSRRAARVNEAFAGVRPPRIAVLAAGAFARGYRGTTIDLLGLNTVSIAHNGGNRRGMISHAAFEVPQFFELNPDVLMFSSRYEPGYPVSLFFVDDADGFSARTCEHNKILDRELPFTLKGLLWDARFINNYTLALVRPPRGPWMFSYFSRSYLQYLRQNNFDVRELDRCP